MFLGHFSYLALLGIWCLPIFALQWLAAPRSLWRARRLLAATVLLCGTALSLADAFAIGRGIWQIHPGGTMGVSLFGRLPVEEALFYYLTTAMSTQGFILLAFYFKPRGERF